jgi:hypothetical protein
MNIIFRRCLGMLNLTEIKRDYYDAEASISIPVSSVDDVVLMKYLQLTEFHVSTAT